jgi:hypothetical protein
MNLILRGIIFSGFFLVIISCKTKESRCTVSFNYTSNIEDVDDIEFLINKRLIIKDSIDFDISVNNGKGLIQIYGNIDSCVLRDILLNQIDDGSYKVYSSQALFKNLLKINDSLSIIRKSSLIDEFKKKPKPDKSSLKGKVNYYNDSVELNELEKKIFNPLFELIVPSADYLYGSKADHKSIGCISVDNFDIVVKILSGSSYIPKNTRFILGNVAHEHKYRDLYIIDDVKRRVKGFSSQDAAAGQVIIYNNTVQISREELAGGTQSMHITSFDLSKSEIDRYVNLMYNKKYLKLNKVVINTR